MTKLRFLPTPFANTTASLPANASASVFVPSPVASALDAGPQVSPTCELDLVICHLIAWKLEQDGRDVLVLHPGSRYLRVGRASDGIPMVSQHVIARRTLTALAVAVAEKSDQPENIPKSQPMDADGESVEEVMKEQVYYTSST